MMETPTSRSQASNQCQHANPQSKVWHARIAPLFREQCTAANLDIEGFFRGATTCHKTQLLWLLRLLFLLLLLIRLAVVPQHSSATFLVLCHVIACQPLQYDFARWLLKTFVTWCALAGPSSNLRLQPDRNEALKVKRGLKDKI